MPTRKKTIEINGKETIIYEIDGEENISGLSTLDKIKLLFLSTNGHNYQLGDDTKVRSNIIKPLNKKKSKKDGLTTKDLADALNNKKVDGVVMANREKDAIKKSDELNPSLRKKIFTKKKGIFTNK